MAEFYTPQPVQGADFTGYSKGFKASTAFGDSMKGLGDALGMAVQATDNYYQGTVKEEAKTQSEKLLNDYGNDAAVKAVGGLESTATPKEIQQGADRLALLNQAQKNGTLKQSSFWAQAELISRQLKMRYPGYWEHIDAAMSSQLGRKPAQALQAELQAEREASASASDKARKDALKAARTVGLTEVLVAEAEGKPIPTDKINVMIANRNNIDWQQQKSQRSYALKKARGEATEEDALSAARLEGSNVMTTMVNNATSPFFKTKEDFEDLMDTLQRQRASGGGVDPELQAQVSALKDQLLENINNEKARIMLNYSGDVPADKLKDTLSFMDEWADMYTSLVSQGDVEVSRSNTALLKSYQDSDAFQFLTSNDALRKQAAMVRAVGPEALSTWQARNAGSKALAIHDIAIENAMTNDTLFGRRTVSQAVREMQTQNITDPKTYNLHLRKIADAVVADEMPIEQRENAAEMLFGEKNRNFLSDDVPNSQRLDVLSTIASPLFFKNAKKLYESGQMPYQTFNKIVGRIRGWSGQLLRNQAADINDLYQHRKARTIEFNEKTGLFESYNVSNYSTEPSTLVGKTIASWNEEYLSKRGGESVQKANQVLKIIKQTAETNGEDPVKVVKEILLDAGIAILPKDTPKQPSNVEATIKATENTAGKVIDNVLSGLDDIQNQIDKVPLEERAAVRNKFLELFNFFGEDTSNQEVHVAPKGMSTEEWQRTQDRMDEINRLNRKGTKNSPIIIDEGADTSNAVDANPDFLNVGKGPHRGI